jgi:GMC oxidoreductase
MANMAFLGLYLFMLFTLVYRAVPSPVSPQEAGADQAPATYDYVIVGCGIAGLVLSMRLTEDENVSVACLEAGPL